jgi:outer membrane murein-binding lipoprotein Lpp
MDHAQLMLAFAMAATLLLAGCSTNGVVHKGYKAAAAETFWYELKGNADTDEAALAQLRTQLDVKLAESRLTGGKNVAGSRRV